MVLYAATTNAGKLAEFAASAGGEGIDVAALPGLREMPEPVEDAATFLGNAELKARAYSLAVAERLGPGMMVMADDSGLEVDALGGAPGVRSARFAEDWVQAHPDGDGDLVKVAQPASGTKDERNNELLLSLMQDKTDRRSRFVCALAVARDGEVVLRAEGAVQGELLRQGRGAGGFGYDPLFLLPGPGVTMAELPREQKWAVSHRGEAFRDLLRQLRTQQR